MKAFLRILGAFVAGVVAALGALAAILYGRGSHAEDRYRATKELQDEIERKAKAAGEAAREEVLAQDPHAVVDSLPPPARERLDAVSDEALAAARRRSAERARELAARRVAPPDGGGPRGDRG